MRNHLSEKHSLRLEWMIVVLITIEVRKHWMLTYLISSSQLTFILNISLNNRQLHCFFYFFFMSASYHVHMFCKCCVKTLIFFSLKVMFELARVIFWGPTDMVLQEDLNIFFKPTIFFFCKLSWSTHWSLVILNVNLRPEIKDPHIVDK